MKGLPNAALLRPLPPQAPVADSNVPQPLLKVLVMDLARNHPWIRSFARSPRIFQAHRWFDVAGEEMNKRRPQMKDLANFHIIFIHVAPLPIITPQNVPPLSYVNHMPGAEVMYQKMRLMSFAIEQGWEFIPRGWKLPLKPDDAVGEPVIVAKAQGHRGVHLVNTTVLRNTWSWSKAYQDAKSSKKPAMAQQFAQRPLLVDGAKFDFGVYVLMLGGLTPTGHTTLRALMYDEISLRFCSKDYPGRGRDPTLQELLEAENDALFVADNFRGFWNIPTLQRNAHLGAKNALRNAVGADRIAEVDKKVGDIIARTMAGIIDRVAEAAAQWPGGAVQHFEMIRFDCFVDQDLSVSVVEINMSPNMIAHTPRKGEATFDDVTWRNKLMDDALYEVASWLSGGSLREDLVRKGNDSTRFSEVYRGVSSRAVPLVDPVASS